MFRLVRRTLTPQRLQGGDDDGAVPRELGQLLPPFFPFLRQLLEVRDDRAQELEDDRGADVRHDAEREDRGVLERAADEQVVQTEERVGRLTRLRLGEERARRRRGA